MEQERGLGGSMGKRFVKTLQSQKFLGMLYTVNLIFL